MRTQYDGLRLWDRVYTVKPTLCNNDVIVPVGVRGHIVEIDDDGMYRLQVDNPDYAHCEIWAFGCYLRLVNPYAETV